MKLVSVNVSLPREITHKGKTVRTGIFKEAVDRRVRVATLNIDGDGQADLIGHGGPFRAVLVYSLENYAYWEHELGQSGFEFGHFGENFTVEGMLEEDVHVGDVFRIGTALFQATQPRVPCYKLAIKVGIENFYSRILESGRPGFYFRVLEEGEVGAGDAIERVRLDPVELTVRQVSNLLYFDKDDLEGARTALRIEALSPGWRQSFEKRLANAQRATKSKEKYRTFVVTRKVPESESITSFYLAAEDGEPLDLFLPGQFLPLRLNIPGQYEPVYRTYSLSDRPGAEHYRLTIKRESAPPDLPNAYPGVSSNYFHDHVDVGATLSAKAPRGRFYLDPQRETPVALVSAGVGQTPMISMLNAIVAAGAKRPTWFVHGSRCGGEHALGDTVRRLAEEHDHVQAHIRYSQPSTEDVVGRDHDDIGWVDADVLKRLLPDNECDFYLCGPTGFMRSLFEGLLSWGVPEPRIHYEFFGPASALKERANVATPKRAAGAAECCTDLEVTFSTSGVRANWNPSFESILDLAEANGLSPDYSCRSGVCQTCVARIEEGEVEYVIEPLDPPDDGSVLICCSKPATAVVIAL